MKWFRKKLRKGELRDIDVDLISLLFDDMKPANRKGAIYKSTDGKNRVVKGGTAKFKSEEAGDRGYLYITVMEPSVKDTQDDWGNKEEIQKACENFAKKGMLRKNDINHNEKPLDDFFIAENYILKTEDKEHFPDTKIGSWVQVIKCENLESEYWKKVKKGQFNGASLAGEAVDLGDNSELIKSMDEVLKKMQKAQEDAKDNKDLADSIATLTQQLESLKADEKAPESEGVTEVVKSLEKAMESLNKAVSVSIKDEGGKLENTEVVINGEKVLVKGTHKEIYKGISAVDGGKTMNILTPNTTSLFIDEVIESRAGDTLSDITVVPLIKDEKIDVGLVQDLVFKNSLDGAVSAQDVASADISCPTGILNAEFSLGRDVVEFYKDKYGEDAFGAYVEQHIAKKAEKAIRSLLFKGDRASATAKLKALDGIVKLATTAGHVDDLNITTYADWVDRFEQVLLGFSDDMLEEQENFKIYISHRNLIKLRSELSQRSTNLGDKLLIEHGKVSFAGIPVKARLIDDDHIVAGLPKFIIVGYRTDAELKVEHHGADWKYHWYIRIRPGITYVNEFVKTYKMVTS
jgi:hypothetical protein